MSRSTTSLLMAVGLAGYGLYAASFVPGMLAAPFPPLLLIGFVLQAVCAIAGAFGVWRGARWAAFAVVLLGVVIAGTWLCEAFIFGLIAYLHALMNAAIALVVTLVMAASLSRRRVTTD